ncbi:adenosylcobinamide-GDP ribazoletransferase [Roseibium sediminicola]|uniref:Adenosylcobinamide-GDP ribazoletransferase n=1 Tax=Roseibium sediminicola TaxID=2933272 RepID=A0ABT0GNZ1_9HYPH|nr:adenosylcobinamide-GDP ribazoletransferase [Roseibium sp. CAU 1639]MCK7611138.1 adenosylcobinamide-GDP ribazoletransferase [Roseibium sp. CAU 1639]
MSSESDQQHESGPVSRSDKTRDNAGSRAARLAADTAACVRFFSRLPLPRLNTLDDPAAAPDFSRIARAAPLAGVVIALPAAALGMLLAYSALPGLAVAAMVAGLLATTTGALHEDGLSDVADGFFGGATRDRRLEIMKDSRIGAFGALALIVGVVLRIALLSALWQRFSPADAALLFLASEAVSRALLVWQWQCRPLARPDGLAARFGKPTAETLRQTSIATLPFLIAPLLLLPLPALILALLLAGGTALLTGRLALQKIGGATGDVLGAVQQISGLGFLVGMLMVP